MAKNRPDEAENDDAELNEYADDKYANVSPNVKKELEKADKERGPKPTGVNK